MYEHFEALEASFEQTYGLDLRRALWGKLRIGVRRLGALISGLPPGSPLHRSLDPDGWGWGTREELAAQTVEQLDGLARLFWQANFKGNVPGQPVKIERPKRLRPKPKRTPLKGGPQIKTPADLKAALAAEGRLLGEGSSSANGGDHGG